MFRAVFFSLLALVIVFALVMVGIHHHRAQSHEAKPSAASVSVPSLKAVTQTPAGNPPPPPLPSFKMAGIHDGQGYEHPMIRKFINNPDVAAGTNYAFHGNKSDAKKVKQWADITAACLAVDVGLVDRKTGKYLSVRKADTIAIDVQNDGKGHLVVVQYAPSEFATQVAKQTRTAPPSNATPVQGVTPDGTSLTAVMVFPTPPTTAQAHFVGNVVNGVDELPAPLVVYDWVHYPPNAA